MRVVFTFPQIVFERREILVPDPETSLCIEEKAKIMLDNIAPFEQDWIPGDNKLKTLVSALDAGYCTFREVTEEES